MVGESIRLNVFGFVWRVESELGASAVFVWGGRDGKSPPETYELCRTPSLAEKILSWHVLLPFVARGSLLPCVVPLILLPFIARMDWFLALPGHVCFF